ncbi:hypothetical protein GCM10028809_35350 [Spirosoma gilvum]
MVFIEQLDFTAAHRHIDDAHPDLFGQIRNQLTAKVIGGRKASSAAAQGWNGGIPLAHFPVQGRTVDGFQYLKSAVHIDRILRLYFGIAFHVRLAEAKEDVKVFVLCVSLKTGNSEEYD